MNKFKVLILFVALFIGIMILVPKSLVNTSSPFINVMQVFMNVSDYVFKSNNSRILDDDFGTNKYGIIRVNSDDKHASIFEDSNSEFFSYSKNTRLAYIENKKYFYVSISMNLNDNKIRNILAKNLNQSYLNHNYKEMDLRKDYFYITSKQKNISFKDFAKNTINVISNHDDEKYNELINDLINSQNIPFDKHSVVVKLEDKRIEFYILPTIFLSEFSII